MHCTLYVLYGKAIKHPQILNSFYKFACIGYITWKKWTRSSKKICICTTYEEDIRILLLLWEIVSKFNVLYEKHIKHLRLKLYVLFKFSTIRNSYLFVLFVISYDGFTDAILVNLFANKSNTAQIWFKEISYQKNRSNSTPNLKSMKINNGLTSMIIF